eukprot:TRINITY_DN8773_c0_g1_i1.p1 TRINITY_DN8773_c0_g1~~TRINITY_DN8773_c0_g1_i1.p1  ORF type:complete len:147 (+),score=53.17 TRINITY_DN8773_c0_g1_i1:134-574(+)
MAASKEEAPEQKMVEDEAPEEKLIEDLHVEDKSEHTTPPQVDPDTAFDDIEEGLSAERLALNFINENNVNILPTKEYIEKTLLTLLLQALTMVVKERPDNPAEFVAYYMLKHNPKKGSVLKKEVVKEVAEEVPQEEAKDEKEPEKK